MKNLIRPALIGAASMVFLLGVHGADVTRTATAQSMGTGQGNQTDSTAPNQRMPGSGMGQGMGPGMMGPGMIYGMPGGYDQEIAPEQVREMLQRRLDWHGNPRLKLGEIKPTEHGEILADIVTQEGSLVQRLAIDRRTGALRQVD